MHLRGPVLHHDPQRLRIAPALAPDLSQPLAGSVQQRGVSLLCPQHTVRAMHLQVRLSTVESHLGRCHLWRTLQPGTVLCVAPQMSVGR